MPPALRARYQVMLEVLAGTCSVSEGARRLRLSRNHFQTLLHRGLSGLVSGLAPKAPGRPQPSAREQALAQEATRLARENQKLTSRVAATDRLLEVASGFLRGRLQATGRATRPKTAKRRASGRPGSDDPDGEGRRWRLDGACRLRGLGVSGPLAAAIVGVSEATIRRWTARARCGRALIAPRGPRRAQSLETATAVRVETLVRQLRGLVGAEALRHSVSGVSRRQAAAIKRATLRAMECERVARAEKIIITTPGVVRGFDAMHLGKRYVFIAGDACVPYRTSVTVSDVYDGQAVASALARDLASHGAPLVCRLDRAKAHHTQAVVGVLHEAEVLVLHGPPRHPEYYGQLERQNRDHRAWLDSGDLSEDDLGTLCEHMCRAINGHWRRAALGWQTPEECWQARPVLTDDRAALREEVHERSVRIRQHVDVRGYPADFAERLAIEQALSRRGYLRRQPGGWC